MPSGRAALVERLTTMMQPPAPSPPPAHQLAAQLTRTLGDALLLVERLRREDGGETAVVVLDRIPREEERQQVTLLGQGVGLTAVETVDRATWENIQRLVAAGVLRLAAAAETMYRSPRLEDNDAEQQENAHRHQVAAQWLDQAERKQRMALLLADGGFAVEACHPLVEAAGLAVRSLAVMTDRQLDTEAAGNLAAAELAERESVRPHLPAGAMAALDSPANEPGLSVLRQVTGNLMSAARSLLDRGVIR